MGFRLLLMTNLESDDSRAMVAAWPEKIGQAISGMEIHLATTAEQARAVVDTVDAVYGKVDPDLFAAAENLRWIQSPQAGPDPSFYHPALVDSDVVVTNMRGIFSDHIGAHIMALVLGFSRGLPTYQALQAERRWRPGATTTYLPEATALIVGVGAIGAEAARLCAAFNMTVIGVDPRATEPPEGMSRLTDADGLDEMLPEADFIIVTAPETPTTQRLFDADKFALMKRSAYFINIGRGATVVLDDLNAALRARTIAGAALDVFQIEPLPADHALWDAPGMVITPHVATIGPYLNDRRTAVFLDNCRRFDDGRELRNIVDKTVWF